MNHEHYPESTASPHELAHPPVQKRGIIIGIALSLLLILGGGGAIAYAAMQGWITIPFDFFKPKPPTIQDINKAISSITSGDTTVTIDYSAQAKQQDTMILPPYPEKQESTSTTEGTSALSKELLASATEQSSKYFMDAKLGIKTQATFDTGTNKDTQGNITITYQNSGMSLTFDTDYVFADESFFIKLNAFPLPFLDFSTITSKWIQFPKTGLDAASLLMGSTGDEATIWDSISTSTDSSTDPQEVIKERQRELLSFRNNLIAKQAIVIQSSELIKLTNNQKIWRLHIRMQPDQLIEAIDATVDDHPTDKENKLFTEDVKTEIHRDGVKSWITDVLSAITSEMDVDAKTFMPIQQTFHLRFATEGSNKLETPKEFLINTTYALNHINQPVAVSAPKDPITFSKAVQLLSGKTDEEVKIDNQMNAITEIRSALRSYKDQHNGQYPDQLSQLIGQNKYDEEDMKYLSSTYQKRVARIPNDLFTGKAFSYLPTGDKKDFALTYEMHFGDASGTDNYLKQMYVEGLNTANEQYTSLEVLRTKDSDNDGVTDLDEKTHGTSPYLKDTDGDGFSDKQEIDGGFDPLTNAKTGAKVKPY